MTLDSLKVDVANNPTLVYIRWEDASTQEAHEPDTPIDDNPLVILEDIGWLIHLGPNSVSICMELDTGNRPGRFRLNIPRAGIKELRVLPFNHFPKRKVTV